MIACLSLAQTASIDPGSCATTGSFVIGAKSALAIVSRVCYTHAMHFEWDAIKALSNERKHGVSFDEAVIAFYDPNQIAFFDPEHSDDETRELLIGQGADGRLLFISYTLRGNGIRIISARKATKREARDYASGI